MPEQGRGKRLRILILLAAVLLVLAAIVIAVVIRFSADNVVSNVLVLPDGRKMSVVAATYGTNHVYGGTLAKWVSRAPAGLQAGLRKLFGARAMPQQTFNTVTPALVVWVYCPGATTGTVPPASPFSYEAHMADTNGSASGQGAYLFAGTGGLTPLQFSAFPRRDRVVGVRVFCHNSQGKVTDCGLMQVLNPEYRNYPQWQPEALPATRRAGDVEATLRKVCAANGTALATTYLPNGGHVMEFETNEWDGNIRTETACQLTLRSLSDTNQVWQVDHVELSDATGNTQRSMGMSWGAPGDDVYGFNPSLWTNEAAWKMRCEIRRTRGFGTNELLTLKNVPLAEMGQTNRRGWSASVNGVTVTLDYIVRRPPGTNSSWDPSHLSLAHLRTSALSNDFHVDLLETRTDTGSNINCVSWSSTGNEQDRNLQDVPADAKTLDFTFSVQQGRWVEFMVKPETGPARFEIPGPRK